MRLLLTHSVRSSNNKSTSSTLQKIFQKYFIRNSKYFRSNSKYKHIKKRIKTRPLCRAQCALSTDFVPADADLEGPPHTQ